MGIFIGAFAYITILYLTLRDLRIFRRTGYSSYRKGAFKGIIASTLVLIGALLTPSFYVAGLGLVFLGVMVNQKGRREQVFTTAKALDRFLGKTDIVRTKEEIYEEYLKQQDEKNRLEQQKQHEKKFEKNEK
ncbi:MAG: hypothetical protein FWH46_01410 [Methanimicrococcus sp.]|nr:hypothetical protein [Methanimicrococcus sp.]